MTPRARQPLMISRPRNHFPLHEGGHVVLLAAGIGITPLLAMAHARAASGASFTLHYYVSRAQGRLRHRDRQPAGGICQIHCSDEGQSRASGWRRIGAPDADTRVTFAVRPDLWRVRDTARAAGWEEAQLHSAASRPPRRRRRRRTEPSPSPSPPPGGWPVPGTKPSPVLQEHGVAVPLSCEMGICGARLTPVREGTVDHRDTVQSEAENRPQNSILRCAAPAACRPI